MNVECPVCAQTRWRAYMQIKGFHHPVDYSLHRCDGCGLIMLDPRPSMEELLCLSNSHFSAPAASLSRMSRYPHLRRIWHSFSGEYLAEFLSFSRGRVLEVGCGFGGLMDELIAAGCDAVGVEPNPDACDHCRSRGLNVTCGVFEQTGLPDASFDGAVLWHVIEHLPDPRAALAEIARLLKPGGTLTIYCPNAQSYAASFFGACWQGWDPPFHLFNFTTATLARLVRENGFDTVSMRTASAEYVSLQSIANIRTARAGHLLRRIPPGFLRSLPGRVALMLLMRVFDAIMPQRGECIRARFVRREDRQ